MCDIILYENMTAYYLGASLWILRKKLLLTIIAFKKFNFIKNCTGIWTILVKIIFSLLSTFVANFSVSLWELFHCLDF